MEQQPLLCGLPVRLGFMSSSHLAHRVWGTMHHTQGVRSQSKQAIYLEQETNGRARIQMQVCCWPCYHCLPYGCSTVAWVELSTSLHLRGDK